MLGTWGKKRSLGKIFHKSFRFYVGLLWGCSIFFLNFETPTTQQFVDKHGLSLKLPLPLSSWAQNALAWWISSLALTLRNFSSPFSLESDRFGCLFQIPLTSLYLSPFIQGVSQISHPLQHPVLPGTSTCFSILHRNKHMNPWGRAP